MKEKVIWIVNQYAGSPYYGMEFRHYYLAREFVKKGISVYIISGSYSHLYKNLPQVNANFTFETIDGIEYCWVKNSVYAKPASIGRFKNMFQFMIRLFRLPVSKMKRPDAVIVSSPSLFPVINAKRWKKKWGTKFIFEVRDIWPLTLVELGRVSNSNPLIMLMGWFEKYGYRHADKLVSVLPNAFEHFKKFGVPEQKFSYVPNGIESVSEKPTTAAVDIKNKFPGKFIIGYAGTLGISNAMTYFIEAARILKDEASIQFVLVGNGGEKESLQQLADGLPNVSFLPPVNKETVPAVLAEFDCCYIGWHKKNLYRYGVSANKIFDYMLAARPIVHSTNSFNDPVSESGCGLTVEAENVEAIADAIKKMASLSLNERLKMGEKGNEFVKQHHNYSTLASKYLQLIYG